MNGDLVAGLRRFGDDRVEGLGVVVEDARLLGTIAVGSEERGSAGAEGSVGIGLDRSNRQPITDNRQTKKADLSAGKE